MENQTPPTKRADRLAPGDIVLDEAFGERLDEFRRVLVAEPIADEPGRVLVVYAGAHTDNVRCTEEFELATTAEYRAFEAERREAEKRARIRAGLMRVVELLDQGLPLPPFLRVEMPCMPDPESVRVVAKAIGVEPKESLNGGRPQIDAETDLFTGPRGTEFEFKAWHLASKAAES